MDLMFIVRKFSSHGYTYDCVFLHIEAMQFLENAASSSHMWPPSIAEQIAKKIVRYTCNFHLFF